MRTSGTEAAGAIVERLGVVIPPSYEPTVGRYVAMAQEVERRGYRTAWPTEVSGADAVGLSCAIAVRTERVRIGIGILPVFTRTAPLLAMGAATLRSLAGDRVVLGLGSSTPAIAAWHGVEHGRPVTRLAETTAAIRGVLSRGSTGFDGRTVRFRGFDLAIAGDVEVPIHIAALGPKNAARAAAYADGVILTLNTVGDLAELARGIREAAGDRKVELTAYARVGVNEDREAVERWMRRDLAWYCSSQAYRDHLTRQGFGEQMSVMEEAVAKRDSSAARAAIDARMCTELAASGSPQEVRSQLAAMLSIVDEVACHFMDFGEGLDGILGQMNRLARD
jgi:alkanesulfonate monooxygenase SsuD/methylene tetrahydromethanopterin reductase-like flavin-dependent oxidoreductase (luciferase family)